MIADARHAVGDGDGFQVAAARESRTADARHAVGDGDGWQAAAAIKSIVADARHAVGNGDGGQAAATTESLIANACHFALGSISKGHGRRDIHGTAVTIRLMIRHLCSFP